MELTYYAERKSIKDGETKLPVYKTGTRAEMERQFYLFCASSATNADGNEVDAVEWGTIEKGPLDRKAWVNRTQPAPEPEPTEETPAEEA